MILKLFSALSSMIFLQYLFASGLREIVSTGLIKRDMWVEQRKVMCKFLLLPANLLR